MNVNFKTLGCKLNYAETSTLENKFAENGFSVIEHDKPTDVVVINTCSVTERANKECRKLIRSSLKKSPNAFVVVTGCYAQLAPEEIASIEGVDLVLGSNEKLRLFEFENNFTKKDSPKIFVTEPEEITEFGAAFSGNIDGRTRAFLKIQDGCDFNCSFCTIPLARGASRSQSIEETVKKAKILVDCGYKEIVLTGVNVGDFGKKNNSSLLELVKKLELISGLQRIRISSIEPNLLEDNLLEYWLDSEKLCKHFHIPLQSGSNDILKMMRRRYTAEQYQNLISKIRKYSETAGIGVDVICGFPGEDKKHFEETFKFIDELDISYLHVFTYSERPNTPSINFENRIEPKTRFLFSSRLRDLGNVKRKNFYRNNLYKTHKVLFESQVDEIFIEGYTENYIRVRTENNSNLENKIKEVVLTEAMDEYCMCRLV